MHTILCKRKSPKGKLHLTYIFVFAALVISTVYQQPELGFDCLSQICFLGNRWIKWTQADGGRSFSFSFFIIIPRSDVNTCDGFTLFLSVLKGTHCRHDFIWSLLKTKERKILNDAGITHEHASSVQASYFFMCGVHKLTLQHTSTSFNPSTIAYERICIF